MSSSDEQLTHLDAHGAARMVDVGNKDETKRVAIAEGAIYMNLETLQAIKKGLVKKGDVLTVARIAGIMAAKQTATLIPLCHPIALTYVDVDLQIDEANCAVVIQATAQTIGKTGVEMEALTAVSVAALTVYDMAKALDKTMRIDGIRLVAKHGGKSGDFIAET